MINLEYQPELTAFIPLVVGNIDYTQWREVLERIDEILLKSGLEDEFIQLFIKQYEQDLQKEAEACGKPPKRLTPRRLKKAQRYAIQALRCNVARLLTDESFRDFSIHLADSPLLQKFCAISCLDVIRVPSKSTLDRFHKLVPEPLVRKIVGKLNLTAASPDKAVEELGLETAIEIDDIFVDTTCVKANIHFPVDWVLLRDVARTLIKAVTLIRKHGLKHRMTEPQQFISQMNNLAIEMTQSRRNPGAKKHRKFVLRKMKKLTKVIKGHAQRHRDLLEQSVEETDLSKKQAQQILDRIDDVLKKLPRAVKQAHERIIGGRQVENKNKIISLYEDDMHVIVRGKAGAEVEFGNTLLLCEQTDGVLIDWQLFEDQAPADCKMPAEMLDRIKAVFEERRVEALATDRGFHSADNERLLAGEKIYNAICPRNPRVRNDRATEPRFRQLQKRRAQTEGRVGIFKNSFLGRPMRSKGFGHRQLNVAWAVLAHNLWVIARLPKADDASAALPDAA